MTDAMEIPQTARLLQRDLDTLSKRAASTAARRDETQRMLRMLHAAAETRFGIELPDDAHLLDVLSCIEVESTWQITTEKVATKNYTDPRRWRWMWQGRTRHGTACVRLPDTGTETTVAHYLARALGLIPSNNRHTLRPPSGGDSLDVNPHTRIYRGRPLIESLT